MGKVKRFLKKIWHPLTAAVAAALLIALVGPIGVQIVPSSNGVSTSTVGFWDQQYEITIGSEVYAAGTADYTTDGTADDVQFQAALDALPATGGRLNVLTGAYSFSATVSRAIDNITIMGTGQGTSFSNNGVAALFSAGAQSNWVLKDFSTDAGGITVTSAVDWTIINVTLGATYYAYDTASGIDASEWAIPTGRGTTFTVAASNASAASIAQADYFTDGISDQVQINAAIAALPASGGTVLLTEGDFDAEFILPVAGVTLMGQGDSTKVRLRDARNSTSTAGGSIGTATITVTDGTQFVAGDFVFVRSPLAFEYRTVQGIAANVVTVTENFTLNHPVGTVVWTNSPIIFIDTIATAYITIKDIKFDGNRTNQMVGVLGNLYPPTAVGQDSGATAAGMEGASIYLWTSSHITVENIHVISSHGHAIESLYSSNFVISNSRFYDSADRAINSMRANSTTDANITIINNFIEETGAADGMALPGSGWGDAIGLHAPTGHKVIIANNIIRLYGRTAIAVGQATNVSVIGNVIEDASLTGWTTGLLGINIQLSSLVSVSGNSVKGGTNGYGTQLIGVDRSEYVTIDGNSLEEGYVYMLGLVGTYMPGIVFSNNVISNPQGGAAPGSAVNMRYLIRPLIIGNSVPDNTTSPYTFYIRDSLAPTALGNTVNTTVSGSTIFYLNNCPDTLLLGNSIAIPGGAPSLTELVGTTTVRFSSQYVEMFMDVLAVSATQIRSNEDLSAGISITFTLDSQPDVPRTLSGHFDTHANITAYSITFTGIDAKGSRTTEVVTQAAGWDWETSNAFATVTSIVMTSRTGTGVGDTMDIGVTDVLGLANSISLFPDGYRGGAEPANVYKIKKNNANAVVAAAQVDTTYDTYDMSVIGLGASDDFTIWYRVSLNIAN